MASLLNNASLLLNPAGSIIAYKEDKINSVIPNNGAGDFTFSGGDGGTRVNQDGYIEQTPANFMLNSGTAWSAYNVTVGTGIADPFGGTGAYAISNIDPGNITDYAYKVSNAMSLPAGTVITLSLYMFGTGTIATYVERSITGTYWFNAKVHTLDPNKWTLFTHTYTVPTDAGGVNVYVGNATGTTSTYVQVAFPMLNYGSTARPYQPTTDRLNYPRITYKNGRGALLQEPQKTNVNTYSQAIVAANGYNVDGCSLTANNAISPDGTQNATLFVESANSNYHRFYKSGTGTQSTKVWTIFAKYKPGGREWLTMDAGPTAYFNIANGTLGNAASDIITQIEPYKDGWYRCTYIDPTSGVNLCYVGAGTYNGDPGNYAGDGRDCFWVWGMQCEDGTLYPTSYIPTTSATVTRTTGNVRKTGVSSLIGQTEGTLYTDFVLGNQWDSSGADQNLLTISDGSYNNVVMTTVYPAVGNILMYAVVGGSIQVSNSVTGILVPGRRYKTALAYKQNDYTLYLNGVQISTDTSATVPACSQVDITQNLFGGAPYSNPPGTAAIFTSRLNATQLAELTTVRSGSGGTISYYGPYTVHTFTGSATFTPSFNGEVEVLVVAGGGGGGSGFNRSACGGGGGAGGLQYVSSYGVSAGTGITVTVGAGGAGGPAGTGSPTGDGTNGSNSVFGGITTIGGGGGTTYFDVNGKNGGSGGGAGGAGGYTPIGGQGIPGQGNNGGNQVGSGQSTDTTSCGGGGGAGAVGANGVTSQRGGNGGDGLPYSISGFSTYYAGGGGGGASQVGGGFAGLGGGGNGGNLDSNGSRGTEYTGGGGGGASSGVGTAATAGGAGGSGVVIIRYLT